MANQIRLTPDAMRQRANEYQQQSDIVGEVISTMDNLLSQLLTEWEGDASAAYEEKYVSLKPGFESMQELIADICKALNTTADIVEQTDADIAGQLRA